MRVNDRNTWGPAESNQAAEAQRLDRGDAARTAGAEANGDRVEFSSSLGRLSRVIAAAGEQHSARVQALANAYQSGKYQPDSLGTARGMIAEALAAERP